MKEQFVKTYRSGFPHILSVGHRFREDAAILALDGWYVASQSEAHTTWGLSKHTITVTYERKVKKASK